MTWATRVASKNLQNISYEIFLACPINLVQYWLVWSRKTLLIFFPVRPKSRREKKKRKKEKERQLQSFLRYTQMQYTESQLNLKLMSLNTDKWDLTALLGRAISMKPLLAWSSMFGKEWLLSCVR